MLRSSRIRFRLFGARLIALGLAVSSAFVVGSTFTAVEQGCAEKAPPPSAPLPIVFGASLSLTGANSGTGSAVRDSIRTAEGQINAAGGLLGRPVVFDIVDDASDEHDIVVGKAEEFVKKGVVGVIGPISSGQVVAVQATYASAHIIEISPTATSTDLTKIQPVGDRWLFRTTPADDFQGAAVILFAQKTAAGIADGGAPAPVDGGPISTCTKLALVHIDNSYGNAMGDVIEQYWPKRSGKPLSVRQKIPVDLASDYKDVVNQVYTAPGGAPECLAFIMYEDTGSEFIREFKADARFTTLPNGFFFIGTDGVYDDTFVRLGRSNPADTTGPNVVENVYGTSPDTQPGTPEYNQFRTLFSSYFPLGDKEAPPFSANGYDAAILLALAVTNAGSTDPVAVRDSLLQVANGKPKSGKTYTPTQYLDAVSAIQQGLGVNYKGASGDVDIDENGNVKSGFSVWQAYRAGDQTIQYRTVGRFDLEALNNQLK